MISTALPNPKIFIHNHTNITFTNVYCFSEATNWGKSFSKLKPNKEIIVLFEKYFNTKETTVTLQFADENNCDNKLIILDNKMLSENMTLKADIFINEDGTYYCEVSKLDI